MRRELGNVSEVLFSSALFRALYCKKHPLRWQSMSKLLKHRFNRQSRFGYETADLSLTFSSPNRTIRISPAVFSHYARASRRTLDDPVSLVAATTHRWTETLKRFERGVNQRHVQGTSVSDSCANSCGFPPQLWGEPLQPAGKRDIRPTFGKSPRSFVRESSQQASSLFFGRFKQVPALPFSYREHNKNKNVPRSSLF